MPSRTFATKGKKSALFSIVIVLLALLSGLVIFDVVLNRTRESAQKVVLRDPRYRDVQLGVLGGQIQVYGTVSSTDDLTRLRQVLYEIKPHGLIIVAVQVSTNKMLPH